MISPTEFKLAWDDTLFALVPSPENLFEGTGISAETQRFLTEAGLPRRAAPTVAFGPPDDALQTVTEDWDVSDFFSRYRVIGSNGSGDPIGLTPDGSVVYLNHDAGLEEVYVNKDVPALAETLLRYQQLIAATQRAVGPTRFWKTGFRSICGTRSKPSWSSSTHAPVSRTACGEAK